MSFKPGQLVLQLKFENPTHISTKNIYKEYLRIQFFGFYYFTDVYSNFIYPESILNLK